MQKDYDEFNVRFFKHLDTPMMIVVFEADEFFIGIFVYLFSLIAARSLDIYIPGGVVIYAFMGIASMIGYIKYKKNKPEGYMLSKLYRTGFIEARSFSFKRILSKKEKRFKVLPYGFIKELRGN